MGRVKLTHVRKLDCIVLDDDEDFFLESCTSMSESERLVGDLALLTRRPGDTDGAVDFDEVECLAKEAIRLINRHVDRMIPLMGVLETPDGSLHWCPWIKDRRELVRKPSRAEVRNVEGESRLLLGAIEETLGPALEGAEKAIRLLAAFGVLCCERALGSSSSKVVGTSIEEWASAGLLFGHAHFLVGCLIQDGIGEDRYKSPLRKGGARRWESHPSQLVKIAIHDEWKRWQGDSSLYAKPTDFRAHMLSVHGGVISDGTLKNWMTKWRRDWVPSRS